MHVRMSILALFITTVLAASMAAQMPPDIAVITALPGPPPLPERGGMITVGGADMDAAPVKGAPFCATIATEHTQVLADGNRIHSTENSTICRDSEGRTRREAGLTLLGGGSQNPPTKLITIVDPVAGFRYMLDTNEKVAHKMALTLRGGPGVAGLSTDHVGAGKDGGDMVYQTGGVAGPNLFFNKVIVKKGDKSSDEPAPATENLGDQTIDGIHAMGTRVTTTIPAGKMGNEQPILVTSERWYSPELKATVITKHNDPWAGELKTQLMNVSTSEPDPSLFSVPPDYKVVEDKAGPFKIQMPPSAVPPLPH
jgi:hypothetical protein